MQLSDKYQKGWSKLIEMNGEVASKVIDGLAETSPNLARLVVEYPYGEIFAGDGLDLKSKEIVAVASLIAAGNAQPQLKVHFNGALNTGSSINELKEIVLQMSIYGGFPKSINAMNILKEVLQERQAQGISDDVGKTASEPTHTDPYKFGEQELAKLNPNQPDRLKSAFGEFSPELIKAVFEHAFAEILSRDNLEKRYRQITTIAALTTLGTAPSELKVHMNIGLNIGLTADDIKDIMLVISVFAGFPAAINGTNLLKEVLAERKDT